nr:putative neurotoxin Na9 precursor [Tityus discrepans]
MLKFAIAVALLLFIGLELREARDGYPQSKVNYCKIYCPNTTVSQWTCKNRAGATDGDCRWSSCYCFNVAPDTVLYGDPGTKPCMA